MVLLYGVGDPTLCLLSRNGVGSHMDTEKFLAYFAYPPPKSKA